MGEKEKKEAVQLYLRKNIPWFVSIGILMASVVTGVFSTLVEGNFPSIMQILVCMLLTLCFSFGFYINAKIQLTLYHNVNYIKMKGEEHVDVENS